MGDAGDAVPIAELLEERRHLLEAARWMLGAAGAAESVVEETYQRWYGLSEAERAGIVSPRPWLTWVAGGICRRRLAPPDRIGDASPTAPGAVAAGRPGPDCGGVDERAHRSLRTRRSRPAPPQQHDLVVRAVRAACEAGDAEGLASLLAPDASAFFDGGGKVRAPAGPVHGSRQVGRTLLTLLARQPRTTVHPHSVNGRTGLVVRYDQQVAAVITLDVAGRQAIQVWAILNPDKLRSWNQRRNPPGLPAACNSPDAVHGE